MVPEWVQIASVIVSPVFAAGGAYMAVKIRLEWLRRDVDDLRTLLARELDELQTEVRRAHARIDEIGDLSHLSTGRLQALSRLNK